MISFLFLLPLEAASLRPHLPCSNYFCPHLHNYYVLNVRVVSRTPYNEVSGTSEVNRTGHYVVKVAHRAGHSRTETELAFSYAGHYVV